MVDRSSRPHLCPGPDADAGWPIALDVKALLAGRVVGHSMRKAWGSSVYQMEGRVGRPGPLSSRGATWPPIPAPPSIAQTRSGHRLT